MSQANESAIKQNQTEIGSQNQSHSKDQDNGQARLIARDITLTYGRSAIIRNLSFEAGRGEILALAGPNGSGKSSLLRALARQIQPVKGKIYVGDTDIWKMSEKEFARKIAYMPQNTTVPEDLAVADLVALGRNPHQNWWQFNPGKGRKAMEEAMERCGIIDLQNKKFGQLSGGEKQRCLIAMALTQEPDFILLDEPTNNLDFHYQQELISILDDLRNRKIGIIAVFHDLNIIAGLADRVALINRHDEQPACLEAIGPVEEALCPLLVRRVFQVDLTIVSDPRLAAPVYVTQPMSRDC